MLYVLLSCDSSLFHKDCMSSHGLSFRVVSEGAWWVTLFAASVALSGCGVTSAPFAASGSAAQASRLAAASATPATPFSKVVVLGDSLSAGFQNGSLLDIQQPNGWASLVARQAGFKLNLPLIASPGMPAVYTLVKGSLPPVLEQAHGVSIGRDDPSLQPDDLAVPGYFLSDILNTAPAAQPPSPSEAMAGLVLGAPPAGTQVQQAIARQPSTIYLWIGNNDALRADGMGDPNAMTPVDQFSSEFTQLMTTLKAGTSAHLFVANIPDVTETPYMTQASEILTELEEADHVPVTVSSALLHIAPGDLVNWYGLADIKADIDLVKAGGSPNPLPPSEVLTASEVAQVRSTTDAYNQVIAQQVAAAGGTLVDVHGYIDSLAAHGVTIGKYRASTLYLGGIFGLDAIHPSNTGYALFANLFIASTNAALGTAIPPVDVAAIAAKDPYFGANRGVVSLPYARPHIGPEAGKAADAVLFGSEPRR